ncbi:hypothetical protein [Cohaesibacter intestini]|uniref:hypothetical protein n=1 Tax=Cohaesibacter intestini TaxID=2211145 RepID=UPI00130065AD|nr:hypothetical protein [Cohaesibacter intestini]
MFLLGHGRADGLSESRHLIKVGSSLVSFFECAKSFTQWRMPVRALLISKAASCLQATIGPLALFPVGHDILATFNPKPRNRTNINEKNESGTNHARIDDFHMFLYCSISI